MGAIASSFRSLFNNYDMKILMLGLDGAGKTTILHKLKLGEIVTTTPTTGFNVETVGYKNINITAWNVSGQDKFRSEWQHYLQNVQGLIFVVDINDRERIGEAKEELIRILSETDMRDIPLLVFANKQDLPTAMNEDEVMVKIGIGSVHDRSFCYQPISATSDDSLYDGLDWLARRIKKSAKKTGRELGKD